MPLIMTMSRKKFEWIEVDLGNGELVKIMPYIKNGSIKISLECKKEYKIKVKCLENGKITTTKP